MLHNIYVVLFHFRHFKRRGELSLFNLTFKNWQMGLERKGAQQRAREGIFGLRAEL